MLTEIVKWISEFFNDNGTDIMIAIITGLITSSIVFSSIYKISK